MQVGGLLAAAALLLAAASPRVRAAPVQFSSSVILFKTHDLQHLPQQNGRASVRCADMIRSARRFGSNQINFVLTQYWVPTSRDISHEKGMYNVDYYCHKTGGKVSKRGSADCFPFTSKAVKEFEDGLKYCIGVAIDQGFRTIMLSPQIDNLLDANRWRNWLDMAPNQEYQGWSWWDIQLAPMAKAIKANLGKSRSTKFLFNMAGEMGTSIFSFPKEYRDCMQKIQDIVQSEQVQVGVKLNHNRVAGNQAKLHPRTGAGDIAALIRDLDFVSVSAYQSIALAPKPEDLQRNLQNVQNEIRAYGASIVGKPLYFGEFGIGGGASQYCDRVAKSAAEAARHPEWGTCWQYQKAMDPWQNKDLRQLAEDYYKATVQWLRNGTGPNWRIEGLFAWNLVSWDLQGVNPLSFAGNGQGFKNEGISKMIQQLNAAAAGH